MKAVNKILRVLVIVFGLASLALFFFHFVSISMGDKSELYNAAQLAFGSKVKFAGIEYKMAKSADILLCFWLTAISFVLSIFAGKSKKVRYAASGFGLAATIYMLVIYLSGPWKFVDAQALSYDNVTAMKYTVFALLIVIALALFTIAAVSYLLLDDYLEVLDSKGEKLTIPKKVVRFFRDYKSEIKKIVWPGYKDVLKNTVVVLVMCLLVGILIWAADFGLGKLLELILNI